MPVMNKEEARDYVNELAVYASAFRNTLNDRENLRTKWRGRITSATLDVIEVDLDLTIAKFQQPYVPPSDGVEGNPLGRKTRQDILDKREIVRIEAERVRVEKEAAEAEAR